MAFSAASFAQSKSYPCQYAGNDTFNKLIGTWQVETKDRTSPGNYEANTGTSVISTGLKGCSIRESYEGMFKGNPYAVEATFLMTDSLELQRVFFDSEHSRAMVLDGTVNESGYELLWMRNPSKKKMQVRFELEIKNENVFEWTTHLTTDFGETWQLTHNWQYTRVSVLNLELEE